MWISRYTFIETWGIQSELKTKINIKHTVLTKKSPSTIILSNLNFARLKCVKEQIYHTILTPKKNITTLIWTKTEIPESITDHTSPQNMNTNTFWRITYLSHITETLTTQTVENYWHQSLKLTFTNRRKATIVQTSKVPLSKATWKCWKLTKETI